METKTGTVQQKSVRPFVFVKEQDFPHVLSLLKNRLPRSCHVHNMVLQQSKFPNRIKILTLNGNIEDDAWVIGLSYREDMGSEISISVPLDPQITVDIKDAFANSGLIDWDQPYLFPATDRSISNMIVEISAFKKGKGTRIFPCYLYYCEEATALAYEIKKPINGEIQKLDIDQGVQFIMNHWKHSREGTDDYLKVLIVNNYSMGIYIKNMLVCGVLTHFNGTIGMLNTSEEYKRQGYAQICMKSLIKALSQEGLVPCSSAEIPNKASIALHEKIGMKVSHVVDYIGSYGAR